MDSSERPQDVVPGQQPHPPMPAPQHPQIPPCTACGGQRVGGLDLIGASSHVGVHPQGKTVWMNLMSQLNAVVCLGCGLTDFYVSDLQRIRDEAQKAPYTFIW